MNVFPQLVQESMDFIAITDNENVEKELAQYSQQIHSFVVYPKNGRIHNFDLELEILDSITFIKSLEELGYHYDEAQALAKKIGIFFNCSSSTAFKSAAIKKTRMG